MSDFPIFLFLTPEAAAFAAVMTILGLACYLMYIGVMGFVRKESTIKSVLKLFGGLVICAMFTGALFYYFKENFSK